MSIRHLMTLLLWVAVVFPSKSDDAAPYTDEGYRLPTARYAFSLPRDHGSHPEFKIEWWYITGHVRANGREEPLGIQATFFRYALTPRPVAGDADFGTNHLYMAHMAVVDPEAGTFVYEERLNRDGWDVAARVDRLELRNGNWLLKQTEGETMELIGTVQGRAAFELELTPTKPLVTFGKDGLSRKGAEPQAASWYLTFPRLAVSGSLMLDGVTSAVTGEAWMDHEISSGQLGAQQVGWDWASVRFHDGRELMVYILRTESSEPDPFSTLAWVDAKGALTHFGPDQFSWAARRIWTSPDTGGRYPIDIDLGTTDPATGEIVFFRLRPLMDAQEMVGHLGGISYWEGACEVLNDEGTRVGESYVELTGYAENPGAVLK